jgi:hypothetical protein
MNITREQLLVEIRKGDHPDLKVDYEKFSTVELWNHYQKLQGKKVEKPKGTLGGGWYSNFTPSKKPLNYTPTRRTEIVDEDDADEYKTPKTKAKDKNDMGLSLQGFGALNLAKGGDDER